MRRSQLEHIIRASATIAEDDEIIGLVDRAVLLERLSSLTVVTDSVRERIRQRIDADFGAVPRP